MDSFLMPKFSLFFFLFALSFGCALTIHAETGSWPPVESADFSKIQPGMFTDEELEVPEKLYHFAQVANAVVETGENRGFLDLAVNRDPQDNKPYNARIMEMQVVLAYFYTADRPWNPYHGDPAVRVRLEAMLDRWTRMQNPEGLFAEYGEDNFSLAPTGFGALAAARTLDLLKNNGQPFDEELIERARQTLRKSLVAMFTNPKLLTAAKQYSNQHSGSYYAAASYLANWPDSELHGLLVTAVANAIESDQSPAGFFYERGGPDFGYSGVHDQNIRIAWPMARTDGEIEPLLLKSDALWNEWLSYNYAPIPNTPDYIVNAGIQTRTTMARGTPKTRVLAEFVPTSRAFAMTDEEYQQASQETRRTLAEAWGHWPPLKIPNAYSYRPVFVHMAAGDKNPWHPTKAMRDAVRASLPMMGEKNLNHQRADSFPYVYTYIKRPTYYAAFNSGRIKPTLGEHRQAYGLGLLWNPEFGPALQAVAETPWFWGTRLAGEDRPVEGQDLFAKFAVGDQPIPTVSAPQDLPQGDVMATYALAGGGEKTLSFEEDLISVTIKHSGTFQEVFPLIHQAGAEINQTPEALEISQNGTTFTVRLETPGSSWNLEPGPVEDGDLQRSKLTIQTKDQLTYTLSFSPTRP